MFISRLTYDMPSAYDYLNANITTHSLHRDIWTFFPNVSRDMPRPFLYSVQGTKVIVVSSIKPECPNSLWILESREYNPIMDNGQGLMFDITFCPSYDIEGKKKSYIGSNLKPPNDENGSKEEQVHNLIKAWFDLRAERLGFKILEFEVTKNIMRKFTKPATRELDPPKQAHLIKFDEISIKGALKVLDVEKLKQTIFSGIGREKGFGCGLLLVS